MMIISLMRQPNTPCVQISERLYEAKKKREQNGTLIFFSSLMRIDTNDSKCQGTAEGMSIQSCQTLALIERLLLSLTGANTLCTNTHIDTSLYLGSVYT